jgi:hypothetical protein
MAYRGPVCKGCGKYAVTHKKLKVCCDCRERPRCFNCDLPAAPDSEFCAGCADKRAEARAKASEARDAVMEVVRKYEAFLEEDTIGVEVNGTEGYASLPQKDDDELEADDESFISIGKEAV